MPRITVAATAARIDSLESRLDTLTSLLERAVAPASKASSPAVAVEAEPDGFMDFLRARAADKVAAGTHVRCQQPGCTGLMNKARTTRINGRRACRRHF